jgi:chromosome partitioning protein
LEVAVVFVVFYEVADEGCGSCVNGIWRNCHGATNLAIMPVGPSRLDIWSSRETVSLAKQVQQHNRDLRCRLLICKKIVGTQIGREAREALESYSLNIINTEVNQRVAYIKAMISGLSVANINLKVKLRPRLKVYIKK